MSRLKLIEGYDSYMISDNGEVFNTYKNGNTKILTKKLGNRGYYTVNLYKNGKSKTIGIHKLVANSFLEKIDGCVINHIDGNKLNNDYRNLEFVSQKENSIHASKLGLLNIHKGESNYNSKLTEKEVIEILTLKGIMTQRKLAEKFNISRSLVRWIHNGTAWSHVKI